jgi:hypothetical protein
MEVQSRKLPILVSHFELEIQAIVRAIAKLVASKLKINNNMLLGLTATNNFIVLHYYYYYYYYY